MKRYLLIVLVCAIIGTTAGLFAPTVRAQISDGSGWAIFGLEVGHFAETALQWIKDELFKTLRDAVVKRIVDDLTDQIIDSIQNGGTPLFVQDPLGALQREGDIAFDTFNAYLGSQSGVDLCAPFQAQLSIYFQTNFQKEERFGLPVRCTFEKFQQALQDSAHFIERGGWVTFQEAFSPSNNFFGATLLVEQAYQTQVAQGVEQKKLEYTAGGGFLGVQKCTSWLDPKTNLPVVGGFASEEDAAKAGAICTRRQTVTPGSIVAEAATKGVLKDFDYAANVQSIISALVNTALSKVFDAAKGGLLAAHSSNTLGVDISHPEFGEDARLSAKEKIDDLKVKYIGLQQHLDRLLSSASTGKDSAYNAIGYCVMRYATGVQYAGNPKAIGPPTWGTLVYGNAKTNQDRRIAVLGDLIDYPHIMDKTRSYEVPGFPGDAKFTIQAGQELYRSTDPNYYPDGRKGYFSKLIEDFENGKKDIQKNLDALNAIPPEDFENNEKATLALNAAVRAYSDFSSTYQTYVSEITNATIASGGEPGQHVALSGSGFSSMIASVVEGLNRPQYVPGIDFVNFYYCETR